jgi:DNA-binding response OmpR family regulator
MSDPTPLQGVSVLIVEDDFYLADDASVALRGAGADVLGPYSEGAEAVAAAEQGRPSCALLDVNLGHGPDFAPARALAARGVPVIFLTGYDTGVIPQDLRARPCLQKPISEARLVGAVREVCGR